MNEAGHGLPARTISQARADEPRLQFNTEEGRSSNDLVDVSSKFDESHVKKIFELAMSFAEHAKSQSEWHRLMTSQKLDQTGKQRKNTPIPIGQKVWFYRPPSQEEAIKTGRKVKHLSHYHGPARVTKQINEHIYEFTFKGKTYQREQGMLIPYLGNEVLNLDFDYNDLLKDKTVQKHHSQITPHEGEYIITKDSPSSTSWYLAQIHRVLQDRVVVHWLTTITPPLTNYTEAQPIQIIKNLEQATFMRTWCLDRGKGRATNKQPSESNSLKYIFSGKIPIKELDQHFLSRNVGLNSQGRLCSNTVKIASCLDIPHQHGAAQESDFKDKLSFEKHISDLESDRKKIKLC